MLEFHSRAEIRNHEAEIPAVIMKDLEEMVGIIEDEFPPVPDEQRRLNGPKAVIIDADEERELHEMMPSLDLIAYEYEEWIEGVRKRVYVLSEDGSGLVEYMKGKEKTC